MEILISGASGHIGQTFLNLIYNQDYFLDGKKIHITAILLEKDTLNFKLNENIDVVYGNITDQALINSLIKKNMVVIHLAGIISISKNNLDKIYDVNYLATKHIADTCLAKGAKLIYTSSVHVLNPNSADLINENAGFNIKSKRGPYEYTKSLATSYIFELFRKGLDGTVVYPSAIIGPEDKFAGEVSQALIMLYKKKMPAYIKGGYSFVDVRDVARAIISAISNPAANKNGYILSSEYISIKNLMNLVYDHYGYTKKPGFCPTFFVYLGLPFIYLYSKITRKKPIFTRIMLKTVQSNGKFDNSKAKKDLDFKPRPLIDSIVDQIDWLKENHPELF